MIDTTVPDWQDDIAITLALVLIVLLVTAISTHLTVLLSNRETQRRQDKIREAVTGYYASLRERREVDPQARPWIDPATLEIEAAWMNGMRSGGRHAECVPFDDLVGLRWGTGLGAQPESNGAPENRSTATQGADDPPG